MARLDGGTSVEKIIKILRKGEISSGELSVAPIMKCRFAAGESPCVFDPIKNGKFSAQSNIHGSAAVVSKCKCCDSTEAKIGSIVEEPTTNAASILEEPTTFRSAAIMEEPTTSNSALISIVSTDKKFESFKSAPASNRSCLDDCCCSSRPIYRNMQPGDYFSRSSIVAGGGDVFNIHHTRAFGSVNGSIAGANEFEDFVIFDSGANRHFFGDSERFIRRRAANLSTTTADGSQVQISEQGDIVLQSEDAHGNTLDPLVLRDVSILKGTPINLVSVGVLCDEGSTFHFEKGNSFFTYQGRKIRLLERDGLYLLRLDDVLEPEEMCRLRECEKQLGNPCTTAARSKIGKTYACAATWDLWHERFGHASKQRLKFIFDNASAEGLEVGGEFKHNAKCQCPTCLSINNAKLHIGDVRKFADQITQKGQLILSDISGPFPVSVDGYRYVISFTDSYSRFSCCYMLRNKSDSEAALEALVSFYARNGILIREIRSDQGGEFGGSNESPSVSGEGGSLRDKDSIDFFFKRVCEKHNIVHTLMPAYRPELHGLAERWNLTVMKMANAMLFSARLSHILWTSAVAHANMLRNRLPLRGLGPYTPYELFYNKRPRVDSLRVFGCDAYKLLPTYPKIPGQLARKRLIYCGETADRVGFRVFDPITYKFSTEFELIFDEHSARKRINSLWEYDARRDLKRHGKLQQLPLQTDDYAEHDTTQEAVRNVFSSASATPTILGIGAAVDDVDSRNGAAGDGPASPVYGSGSSPLDHAAHFKQRVERDPSTSSSRTVSMNEPGNDMSTSESNHHGFLNLPSSTSEGAASSNQSPEILRHMNGRAVSQRPQSDCKRDTVPTIMEEGDDDDEPEEF